MTVLPQHLESLDRYIGGNEWLANDLSYVDFLAYELLDAIKAFSPTSVDSFERLNAYIARFEEVPAIKKYHGSEQFKRWPFYTPESTWGYNK